MSYPSEDYEVVDRLAREAARTETDHGHREDWMLADRLEEIADGGVLPNVSDEPWADDLRRSAEALRKNIIGMKLALIHSEISEALERLRDVGVGEIVKGDEEFQKELADIIIRALGHSDLTGAASIGQTLVDKMKANEKRPHMHGRAA